MIKCCVRLPFASLYHSFLVCQQLSQTTLWVTGAEQHFCVSAIESRYSHHSRLNRNSACSHLDPMFQVLHHLVCYV